MKKLLIFLSIIILVSSCKKNAKKVQIDKYKNITSNFSTEALSKDSIASIMKNAVNYYTSNGEYDRITSIYLSLISNDRYAKTYIDSAYSFALKMKAMKNDSLAVKLLSSILDKQPDYNIDGNYLYIINFYMKSDNELYATKIIKEVLPITKSKKLKIELYKDIIDVYTDLDIDMLAFQYSKKAIEDVGDDPDILYRYGDISYKIGKRKYETKDYSAALFYINKTISAGLPESIQDDAYLLKGEIYFDEGLYDKAKIAFNKVLELNPYRQGQTVKTAQKYINEIEDKEL